MGGVLFFELFYPQPHLGKYLSDLKNQELPQTNLKGLRNLNQEEVKNIWSCTERYLRDSWSMFIHQKASVSC
jgi:hypothetical protein